MLSVKEAKERTRQNLRDKVILKIYEAIEEGLFTVHIYEELYDELVDELKDNGYDIYYKYSYENGGQEYLVVDWFNDENIENEDSDQ